MEVHNFDRRFRQVADEVTQPVKKNLFENEDPNLFGTHEIRRWYLKETADEADGAETAREDAGQRNPWPTSSSRPRRTMTTACTTATCLSTSFTRSRTNPVGNWLIGCRTTSSRPNPGTWRLPASSEEEQIKAQGRQSGLTRKVRRYVSCIEAGLPISSLPSNPSNSDLAEWIRHCKRSGL